MLVSGVFSKHDEWYCKKAEDKYEICRKCKTLDEDCDEEAPADCKCENLKFANTTGDYEMVGGPETCQTKDPFCYVTEDSSCDDAEYSTANYKHRGNIWLNPEVYYSYDACDAQSQDDNTGNEEILEGVKITGNNEDQEFEFETFADCQEACSDRCGQCGSWSFDKSEKICYLHSVDSCCGQFGKREINSGFTSGYNCQECWSTKANTDCPCSLEDGRQEGLCPSGTAHSSGSDNQCTGEIELKNFQRDHNITKTKRRYGWGNFPILRNRWNNQATLTDGSCCWTVTGFAGKQTKEIRLTQDNPVEKLGFNVRRLKAHKCT